MEQRSNPDRIEHLSQQLKKKRNALEDAVFSEVNKASRLVERAYSAYPEWVVRSAAQKVDGRIGEIRKQMNDILKLTDTQSRELLEVSGEYRRVEREMAKKAKLAMQPLRFLPAVVKRDLPSLLLSAVGAWKAAEPEGIAGFRERIQYRVKNAGEFLNHVFDRLLTAKVSYVKEDPIIAELLGRLKNGSAEEQTEARKLLMEAAKALQDIAESQQAYDVYAVYGNTAYMEEEQQRAEEAREKLRQLGISESYYGADTDLTVLLGDKDPLKSVQYNPFMNDHSPMPEDEELLALIRNGFEGIIPNMTLEGMQASYAVLEEQIKERERQAIIDAYIKSMLPPTHLPDGTPITADNKVNETTYAYFEEHVLYKHEDYMYVNVPYTAYDAWVKDTYGRTGWEEAVHLSDIFIRSLGEELITGVIDLGSTVVEFVIDPVKVTKEAMESAKQTASKWSHDYRLRVTGISMLFRLLILAN
ncbi:hypothetical protein D3P08_19075 [Paenibacillus nanensis]|uniref:LXG domain-containing protein n=1 Tax=Paenibacillus nanensis TaxID=393251 RepID=A0A3A1UTR2_9BACL|nr:hypothetical protein D3P08_19075 [Paenibacillus nanensis]